MIVIINKKQAVYERINNMIDKLNDILPKSLLSEYVIDKVEALEDEELIIVTLRKGYSGAYAVMRISYDDILEDSFDFNFQKVEDVIIAMELDKDEVLDDLCEQFDDCQDSLDGIGKYIEGYDDGLNEGLSEGCKVGYNKGYDKALKDILSNLEDDIAFDSIWENCISEKDIIEDISSIIDDDLIWDSLEEMEYKDEDEMEEEINKKVNDIFSKDYNNDIGYEPIMSILNELLDFIEAYVSEKCEDRMFENKTPEGVLDIESFSMGFDFAIAQGKVKEGQCSCDICDKGLTVSSGNFDIQTKALICDDCFYDDELEI